MYLLFVRRLPSLPPSFPPYSNTDPTHANDALNRRRQIIQSFAWQVIITSCRSSVRTTAKRSDFPTVTRVICISLWEFEQPRKLATEPNRSSTFRSRSHVCETRGDEWCLPLRHQNWCQCLSTYVVVVDNFEIRNF